MSAPVIDLYGRPGCHLCDDARDELAVLAAELGFTVREHDIEADDDLLRRYLERIPVIVIDGDEVCDFYVDAAEIRRRLDTVRGA
jgi:glutaredoxin